MTLGTWASGGFVAIDGTNMPGWYQLGIPNAALASGAETVEIHLKGASNMVPVPIKIQLVEAGITLTKCDISAASSGTSFTIASCVSDIGETITIATGSFSGRMMKAYTNGAAACNVVGESVFAQTVDSGGVVVVRTSAVTGGQGGFTATPSTSNCGIYFAP
jgi:hypothetical protein